MVNVAAAKILVGLSGAIPPAKKLGSMGLQICTRGAMHWSKKPVFIRNAPHTIDDPTLGQIETRLHFADVAHAGRGISIDPETGLPGAASVIQRDMEGYRAPSRLDESEYPSKTYNSHVHSVSELQAMYNKKRRARQRPEMRFESPRIPGVGGAPFREERFY